MFRGTWVNALNLLIFQLSLLFYYLLVLLIEGIWARYLGNGVRRDEKKTVGKKQVSLHCYEIGKV